MVSNDDNDKGNDIKVRILAAFDELLDSRPWDTLFLRAIRMQLKQARDEFADAVGVDKAIVHMDCTKEVFLHKKLSEEEIVIYIHLYNLEGDSIDKWEKLISNLNKQIISRPVYRYENDVREVIRTKRGDLKNEAYVAVGVNVKQVNASTNVEVQRDRLGHELVSVKDNAINLRNFKYFIHKSGRYNLKDSKLIHDGDVNLNENIE